MEDDINGLIAILQKEVNLCEELLYILDKERDALRSRRVEDLFETTKEKETYLIKIRILEESKKALIHRLAIAWQVQNEDDLTLSKICPIVPPHLCSRLEIFQERLRDLTLKIKKFNDRNRSFLESSIKIVEECISLLLHAEGEVKNYLPSGKTASIYENGRLLNRSA